MDALKFLENATTDKNNLDEMILAFEKMCEIPIDSEEEKMILFETGTFSFTGKPMFTFSLVRQYPNEDEEYFQIHLDIQFEPTEETKNFQQATWNFDVEGNIFDYIKNSQEYLNLKNTKFANVEIFEDET